jgi:hypothetical protein
MQEEPVTHHGDIDGFRVSLDKRRERIRKRERHAERARKEIHGAQGNDTKRNIRALKPGSSGRYAAVAATDDQDIDILLLQMTIDDRSHA